MIEGHLGGNLPASFKTIDKRIHRILGRNSPIITSIKSLNTNNPSYSQSGGIFEQLAVNKLYPSGRVKLSYIDQLAEFETASRGGVTVTRDANTQLRLELAIPTTPMTVDQWSDVASAMVAAQQKGIRLDIVHLY